MSLFGSLFNRKQPDTIDPTQVVPVLRTALPGGNAPVEIPEQERPIVQPLAADIIVCYAVDWGSMLRFIRPIDCPSLGVEPSGLRRLAMGNIGKMIPALGVSTQNAPFFRVNAQGHESVVLLARSFWEDMAPTVGSEILAAVPSRDVLIFAGNNVPGAAEQLKVIIEEIYPQATTPLSRHLLLRRDNKWHDFDATAQ